MTAETKTIMDKCLKQFAADLNRFVEGEHHRFLNRLTAKEIAMAEEKGLIKDDKLIK